MKNYLDIYLENMFNNEPEVKEFVKVSGGIILKEIDGFPHILLIQRSSDDHWPLYWEIPRGKCDQGNNERLNHCLKREIKEETGLDVKPVKFVDSFSYYVPKDKRKSKQYNFLCVLKDVNQPVKLSKEHQDYKWIKSLGEIKLMVAPPEINSTLTKVLNASEKVVDYGNEIIEEK